MKHKHFKNFLSLLLAAILLLSAGSVALAAYSRNILVYVPDFTELALFYNDGTTMREVYNVHSGAFMQTLASIGAGLMASSEKPQSGADMINNAVDDIFYTIACDDNGDSVYSVGAMQSSAAPFSFGSNTPVNTENLQAILANTGAKFTANDLYVFFYDWRMSPIKNAMALEQYIEDLKTDGQINYVTVLSAGYGGVIVNTLLAIREDNANTNIERCIFLDSFLEGSSVLGDLMTGSFAEYASKVNEFGDPFNIKKPDESANNPELKQAISTYISQDPTGIAAQAVLGIVNSQKYLSLFTTSFLTLLTAILSNEGVIDKIAAGIHHSAKESAELIYGTGLRKYLRNMAGLWALVPEEGYENAMRFLFGDETPSEQLLEQLDSYRRIQESTRETLRSANEAGITIAIVAGYNRQILPLSSNVNETSDGLVPTRYAGAGVLTNDMNTARSFTVTCTSNSHRHLSPDAMLNASTCYLPEQTWFIKNHQHMDYTHETVAAFIGWLLTSGKPSVFYNEQYPQFLVRSLVGEDVSVYEYPDHFDRLYTYGDITMDGAVNAEDARAALRLAVDLDYPNTQMLAVADVDGDDAVSAEDARLILRYAVGLENDFMAEYY